MRPQKHYGAYIPLRVSAELVERLERVAPTLHAKRSAFIREAIIEKLARVEAEREREQAAAS